MIEPTLILLEETSALDAVPVIGPPGGVTVVPEPAAGLSLLTAAALAAPALLRRRPGGKGCEHIASRRGAGRRDVVNALAAR